MEIDLVEILVILKADGPKDIPRVFEVLSNAAYMHESDSSSIASLNGKYSSGKNVGPNRLAHAFDWPALFILTAIGAIRLVGNAASELYYNAPESEEKVKRSKVHFKVETYENELIDVVCNCLDSEERNRFAIKTPEQLIAVLEHLVKIGDH